MKIFDNIIHVNKPENLTKTFNFEGYYFFFKIEKQIAQTIITFSRND